MILPAYGDITRIGLDAVAKNVYTLLPEEYNVVANEDGDNIYVLNINTLRRFEPIIKLSVAPSRSKASISLYPGINSPKILSNDDILEVLKEKFNIETMYVKKDVLFRIADFYRQGFIVENVEVIESIPVIDGKNAVIKIYFEKPSQRPKLLSNGKVDYKSFTNYIMVKKGDILIRRVPATVGQRGFDVTGAEITPLPGKDVIYEVIEGVSANEDKTEYVATQSGHVIYTETMIGVLPLLHIKGNVDYSTGNINFDGAVRIEKDVLTGFSVNANDIMIGGIDEDAQLTAKNSVDINTGIKGVGHKGFVKSGFDVISGYAENAIITAKNSIEIKKYCFNSILTADKVIATTQNAIVTGGTIKAFSLVRLYNAGSNGTNDMLISVGLSQEMEDRAKNIKNELFQIAETLKKIATVLSKTDLKNPAVIKNPKIRKLLETASMLKRKQPLLEAKLEDTQKKSIHPDPRIIIENIIRVGVKIKIYNASIELKNDMSKVEFFFDSQTKSISFQTLNQ